jgi:hypothetical protein
MRFLNCGRKDGYCEIEVKHLNCAIILFFLEKKNVTSIPEKKKVQSLGTDAQTAEATMC